MALKLYSSDAKEIQKLASSPSFLRLADSLLRNMDRATVSDFLAAYLYFKAEGRTGLDFVLYVVVKRFRKGVTLGIDVIAALIPGLLADKRFRSVILGAATKSFRGRQKKDPKSVASREN